MMDAEHEEIREDAKAQRDKLMTAERKGRKAVAKQAKQLERLEIDYVDCDAIKANAYNPNRQSDHDFELLLRSMEEDGFTQPVVAIRITADTRKDPQFVHYEVGDTVIVDGEHRWRAAQRLGFEAIPVVYTEMTPEQMRIATLRHNRARGSEDMELSAQVLRDLEQVGALDWASDSLMLSDVELQRLMEDVPAPEQLADESHSEAWVPDKSQQGDGEDLSVEAVEKETLSGKWTSASSSAAVEARRKMEDELATARNEEQRELIRNDAQREFHRVSLILHGDQAKIVREVLGTRPAETLVALCVKESGEVQASLGEGWVAIEQVIGSRTIPAEAAAVIVQALDTMGEKGDLTAKNRWQGLEYLAASYNAGDQEAKQ